MKKYTCTVFCKSVFEMWMKYGARVKHFSPCKRGVYATVEFTEE